VLGGATAPYWSWGHLDYLQWRWEAFTQFFLSGGMIAATLLIYRILGYRFCRSRSRLPDGTLAARDVQSPNEGLARHAGTYNRRGSRACPVAESSDCRQKYFRLFFKIGHFYRPLFAPFFNWV
jgi:hypothetical protein